MEEREEIERIAEFVEKQEQAKQDYKKHLVFASDDWAEQLKNTHKTETGIIALDLVLGGGLSEQLSVLVAQSGIGKTGLSLQVAEHIAINGRPVLFFSAEQTREELEQRIMTRFLQEEVERLRVRPLENLIEEARKKAKKYKDNFYILDEARAGEIREQEQDARGRKLDAVFIREYTEKFIYATGKKPYVFVDYLQYIKGSDKDERTAITDAIMTLNLLSQKNKIGVFVNAITARDHYYKALTLDAVKGAGEVDATAYWIIGLQRAETNSKDTDENGKMKSGAIRKAESKEDQILTLNKIKGRGYVEVPVKNVKYNARTSTFYDIETEA